MGSAQRAMRADIGQAPPMASALTPTACWASISQSAGVHSARQAKRLLSLWLPHAAVAAPTRVHSAWLVRSSGRRRPRTSTAAAPLAVAWVAERVVRYAAVARNFLRTTGWLLAAACVCVVCPLVAWLDSQMLVRRRGNRPRRIILVRNGQSVGNVDKTVYQTTPDSVIPLTSTGFQEAEEAGQRIRKLIGDESVRFFFSPYIRTRQTLMSILQAFDGRPVSVTAEPRVREQDFGNFRDAKRMEQVCMERRNFGRFYYRFPNGEASTDVYDRVAEFWSTLYRFMDQPSRWAGDAHIENFVVVTHGLLLRIFCMCYFRWTVREFDQVWNPTNADTWVLEKMPSGRYQLRGRLGDNCSFETIRFGPGQGQPLYEHMKQPLPSRKVVIGSPNALDADMLAHLRVPGPPAPIAAEDE